MSLKVFIQNESGSNVKNRHNEKTMEFLRSERVSRDYPFPYGFIIGTTAEDGLNLDCFVITERKLRSGEIVECDPVGLMEQIEDGKEHHNVLAAVEVADRDAPRQPTGPDPLPDASSVGLAVTPALLRAAGRPVRLFGSSALGLSAH